MKQPATILVVDDDEDIRFLADVTLGRLGGFDVVLAADGDEALAIAVARRPDLILLDEMMPAPDGPATLARLRDDPALASIPVVFLTGRAGEEDRIRHRELGALETIAKPFEPDALCERVRELLAGRPGT